MNDTYYYGQGKVFLSVRNPVTNKSEIWRWIGDVSALTLKLSFEQSERKISRAGVVMTSDRRYTSFPLHSHRSGTISPLITCRSSSSGRPAGLRRAGRTMKRCRRALQRGIVSRWPIRTSGKSVSTGLQRGQTTRLIMVSVRSAF
jgi:hypothetical protein